MKTKPEITFDEFMEIEGKLSINMGYITLAERVPKSNKLLKLTVNFGDEIRTSVTNLGEKLKPEEFVGLTLPFITNLKPSKMMGVESQAMIMPSESPEGFIQLTNPVVGSKVL